MAEGEAGLTWPTNKWEENYAGFHAKHFSSINELGTVHILCNP